MWPWLVKVLVNVEEEAHRAQAPVFSLLCCLTHAGMSAGCETASSGYETHEESSPACSLLFTALTSSEASAQERFLPSPVTGLLVVPLQWVTHSQVLCVRVALSGCAPAQLWDPGRAGVSGACPWLVWNRAGNSWPKVGHSS